MNLEEIITAAVEKRIGEIVLKFVNFRESYDTEWHPTALESAVGRAIQKIAEEEVVKYDGTIRIAIQDALSKSPTRFEISAYSKITIPKE